MKEVIIKLDTPNKNGLIYPRAEVEKALAKLGNKELLGTVGYPIDGAFAPQGIDAQQVAFLGRDLRIEGDCVVGDIEILETPMGQDLSKMIAGTPPISMSFRTMSYGYINEGVISDITISSLAALDSDLVA
jgi:hypothetical protein